MKGVVRGSWELKFMHFEASRRRLVAFIEPQARGRIYEGFHRITAKLTTLNFHKLKAKGILCLYRSFSLVSLFFASTHNNGGK